MPYQGSSQQSVPTDGNIACFPGDSLRKRHGPTPWAHDPSTYQSTAISVPSSVKEKRDAMPAGGLARQN